MFFFYPQNKKKKKNNRDKKKKKNFGCKMQGVSKMWVGGLEEEKNMRALRKLSQDCVLRRHDYSPGFPSRISGCIFLRYLPRNSLSIPDFCSGDSADVTREYRTGYVSTTLLSPSNAPCTR